MYEVKVIKEFYFSQLLGRPIVDAQGHTVGKIKDMIVEWNGLAPQVTALKYTRGGKNLIPFEYAETWADDNVKLSSAFSSEKTVPLKDDEIYISKWLLDKQIIDLKGSRLVRVNDIALSLVERDNSRNLVLGAVDIGIRGLFRRLGLEFLVKNRPSNLVGWQYIKPLEKRTSSLQLNMEKQQMEELHPADIAQLLEDMDYRNRATFVSSLGGQRAVDALTEMELDTQVEIIEQMDKHMASDLLEEMSPDDAADILGELSEEKSEELLSLMESEEAEEVRELMQYDEETAGALMTTEYIGLPIDMTAEQTINKLRELAPEAETIYYIFVVDETEQLQGVLSLRELIIAAPQTALKDIMHTKIIKVHHSDDHDTVAELIHKYNLLAIPVVGDDNTMLGIITVDDVIEILRTERSEWDVYSNFVLRKHRSGRSN